MPTGSKPLAKVKALGEASKSDLVRSAGYVSTTKDGTERLNFTAFYEALLEAKGMNFGSGRRGRRGRRGRKGRRGRSLSFATKIEVNGNLLVGKVYTAQLGLEPGDAFELKLSRKQIKPIPLGAAEVE